MNAVLIVNPRSGNGGVEALLEAASGTGVATHVLRKGDDPAEVARSAAAGILGVAGGDGSLAAVASIAIEQDVPFVCVPFGTRNHFARDLGLDRNDPVAALGAFTDGRERRIDVGSVNGRRFLNNVSLGAYARLVHRREHHRHRRDALARLRAIGTVLLDRHRVDLTVDSRPTEARVVLVSNNAYDLDVLSIGERARLDEGALHVYTPVGLLRSDWHDRRCERVTVDASTRRLPAAIDGEPETLTTPLQFAIEPLALRVLLPAREDEGR